MVGLMARGMIRLYLDQPLGPGQSVALDEAQAHYLFAVMREGVGTAVLLFNGRDGEWLARVESAGKRAGVLRCDSQTRVQGAAPDLWLLFAPVKKARTDFIVEKAVELGVAHLVPVQTDFTNADRIRQDKAEAHVREAAEQCEATWLPTVAPLTSFERLLAGWDPSRRILWADEGVAREMADMPLSSRLAGLPRGPGAVLVGPEGGFSEAERARLSALPFVVPVRLGPRILRAETAALALLTLWQTHLGDW